MPQARRLETREPHKGGGHYLETLESPSLNRLSGPIHGGGGASYHTPPASHRQQRQDYTRTHAPPLPTDMPPPPFQFDPSMIPPGLPPPFVPGGDSNAAPPDNFFPPGLPPNFDPEMLKHIPPPPPGWMPPGMQHGHRHATSGDEGGGAGDGYDDDDAESFSYFNDEDLHAHYRSGVHGQRAAAEKAIEEARKAARKRVKEAQKAAGTTPAYHPNEFPYDPRYYNDDYYRRRETSPSKQEIRRIRMLMDGAKEHFASSTPSSRTSSAQQQQQQQYHQQHQRWHHHQQQRGSAPQPRYMAPTAAVSSSYGGRVMTREEKERHRRREALINAHRQFEEPPRVPRTRTPLASARQGRPTTPRTTGPSPHITRTLTPPLSTATRYGGGVTLKGMKGHTPDLRHALEHGVKQRYQHKRHANTPPFADENATADGNRQPHYYGAMSDDAAAGGQPRQAATAVAHGSGSVPSLDAGAVADESTVGTASRTPSHTSAAQRHNAAAVLPGAGRKAPEDPAMAAEYAHGIEHLYHAMRKNYLEFQKNPEAFMRRNNGAANALGVATAAGSPGALSTSQQRAHQQAQQHQQQLNKSAQAPYVPVNMSFERRQPSAQTVALRDELAKLESTWLQITREHETSGAGTTYNDNNAARPTSYGAISPYEGDATREDVSQRLEDPERPQQTYGSTMGSTSLFGDGSKDPTPEEVLELIRKRQEMRGAARN